MKFKVTNPKQVNQWSISYRDQIKEMVLEFDQDHLGSFVDNIIDSLNEDSDWPLAVNPLFIIDTNNLSDCQARAKNVIDMIVETDLYGMSVLDFGCGDGTTSVEMLNRGAKAVVGYDIKPHQFWTDGFTTKFEDVINTGPYDLVLLYDVLDHIVDQEPSEVLKELSKVLSPHGIITVRNHPWCSRHGTHLYTQFNRAFAHMIFSSESLERRGYTSTPTRKIIHPVKTYKKWFEEAELKIIKEDKIFEPVEDYFLKNELYKLLIQKHYNESPLQEYKDGKGDLGRILGIHFVDYIIGKIN